jgi:hypothetical protein
MELYLYSPYSFMAWCLIKHFEKFMCLFFFFLISSTKNQSEKIIHLSVTKCKNWTGYYDFIYLHQSNYAHLGKWNMEILFGR